MVRKTGFLDAQPNGAGTDPLHTEGPRYHPASSPPARAAGTMTFLRQSARANFPMRGYSQRLTEAHAHTRLRGLEVEVLEETLLAQLANGHPAAAQAGYLRLFGFRQAAELTDNC